MATAIKKNITSLKKKTKIEELYQNALNVINLKLNIKIFLAYFKHYPF